MYCFFLLCTNTMDLPTGWQDFFYFHGKLIICKWTCELTYFMSRDYYQLILFTLVDKLHICVLLICFIFFFCAVSYYLFIHVRKTWTRKYTYTLLELKSGNIRNLFHRKNHNKTLNLDIFFTTSGNEEVYILAAGQVFSIKWYQIKQVDINRLQ